MARAVWRIRYGDNGWLKHLHHGPVITATLAEAVEYPTKQEAERVLASLPATKVARWVEPGPATEGGPHYRM